MKQNFKPVEEKPSMLYREDGTEAGFKEGINWWLEHYRGLEHFFYAPEIAYTLTSILERCLTQIKAHMDDPTPLSPKKPKARKPCKPSCARVIAANAEVPFPVKCDCQPKPRRNPKSTKRT